jgi:hypothetical protein
LTHDYLSVTLIAFLDIFRFDWLSCVMTQLRNRYEGKTMSADLHLTSQVLDDLSSALSGFSGQLATACTAIRNGDSNLTGTDPLAGQVHGFAGSWNYGLTQLGQHATACVGMLRQVGTTFDQLDTELAGELTRST